MPIYLDIKMGKKMVSSSSMFLSRTFGTKLFKTTSDFPLVSSSLSDNHLPQQNPSITSHSNFTQSNFSNQKYLLSDSPTSLFKFLGSITRNQSPIINPDSLFSRSSYSSVSTTKKFISLPELLNPNTRRFFSTESTNSDKPQNPTMKEFKHQEIEGPTVERDLSDLANEMRQVQQVLMKNMFDISRALALMGLVHLGYGAWISYATQGSPLSEVSFQSISAFAFPFSLAFLIRNSMKPMVFFKKMEEQGRLQILTLNLQIVKSLNLLLLRARGVSLLCSFGLLIGLLFTAVKK